MEKSEIIKEFLQKANINNVYIYQEVLNGNLDITDTIVKNAVTQPTIYQELFDKYWKDVVETVDSITTTETITETTTETTVEDTVEDTDNDDTNDIKFTIDDKEYVYKGDPKNTITTAFKSLKIKGVVYNGDAAISTKETIDTLAGLTLSKTKVEITEPSETTGISETTEEA